MYKEALALCKEYGFEVIGAEGYALIMCPKMPDRSLKTKIKKAFPEGCELRFEEGPRVATRAQLGFMSLAGSVAYTFKGHELTINLKGEMQKEEIRYEFFETLYKNDPYVQTCKLLLNGEEVKVFASRVYDVIEKEIAANDKIRDTALNDDDILNVKILTGSCKSVDDFLKAIGG